MNKSVYSKTIENVKNRVDVKLFTNVEDYNLFVVVSKKIFKKNL